MYVRQEEVKILLIIAPLTQGLSSAQNIIKIFSLITSLENEAKKYLLFCLSSPKFEEIKIQKIWA